jgi:DNA-binding transcriptional regulator YiaG
MPSHPNRSGRGASRNPSPEEIRALREEYGLSAAELGALVHSTGRRAQEWMAGTHRMHPGLWELLRLKVGLQ